MDYKAYALVAILLASVALVGTAQAQTSAVTVKTDKPSYEAGEDITISGTVTNVQTGQSVLIQVKDPKGALARIDPVAVAADGSWTYPFRSGGPLMALDGDYTVLATYRSVTEETTFAFDAGKVWREWTIVIDGTAHIVRYMIEGGSVTKMEADVDLATLTVTIASTSNGNLTIDLERDFMQALSVPGVPTGGSDIDYVVFVDEQSGDILDEERTATSRILTIPFGQGSEEIEIIGSWLVPEFGAIAAIVLAVAIVGIIVATTRYGK
ncbi:MAG: PEFG-CTERM sorting domain-containing protein, partial [Nitrososphaera sp.]